MQEFELKFRGGGSYEQVGGGGGGHNCGTPTVVLSVILGIIIKLQLVSTKSYNLLLASPL